MNTFFYPLQKLNGFERAKECLDTGKTCQVTGCADSQLAHFITGLSDGYKNKVIVTFSGTKAKELYEDLKAFDKMLYCILRRISYSFQQTYMET